MNLPISWFAAVPVAIATKQAVSQTASSLSHSFGDFLQPSATRAASGPSAPTAATSKSTSDTESLQAIQNHLSQVATKLRQEQGSSGEPLQADVEIIANANGDLQINAPDDLKTGLRNYLSANPSLISNIQRLAKSTTLSSPLSLLPNRTNPVGPKSVDTSSDPSMRIKLLSAKRIISSTAST